MGISRTPDDGHTDRIPSLDGLRAVSILMVVVGHLAYGAGFHAWWTDAYAHAGVRVFFVISGYLITTLLLREREETGCIGERQFYIRRAWRILPVAYAYLLCITIARHKDFSWPDLALSWTYLTSYAYVLGPLPWDLSHLWSLSVEEQFYAGWPLLVAGRMRWAKRVAWVAILAAPLCRYWFRQHRLNLMAIFSFPVVIDSLATGCLIALYTATPARTIATRRWAALAWVAAFMAPQLVHVIGEHPRIFAYAEVFYASVWTLFNLCVGVGVLWAVATQPRVLNHWFAIWIGTISYGLYIWQMPFMNPDTHLRLPVNLLAAVGVAAASYYLLEQPLLRMRRHVGQTPRKIVRKAA